MKWLAASLIYGFALAGIALTCLDVANRVQTLQRNLDAAESFVLEYREELARVRGHCEVIDLGRVPSQRKGI